MSEALATRPLPRARRQGPNRLGAIGWVVGLYLVGRMFMVFGSGRPQPADIGLAIAFVVLLRPHHFARLSKAVPAYVAFVAWAALLSALWGTFRGTLAYGIFVLFQTYNLAIMALVFSARLTSPQRFDGLIAKVLPVAAWTQFVVLVSDGTAFRATGTFRNSNQLAYWSVCTLALYLSTRPGTDSKRDMFVITPLAWAALTSTSRAGVVAFSVLTVTWLYDVLRNSPYRAVYASTLVFGAAMATTLPAFGDYLFELEVSDHVGNRFASSSSTDEVTLRNTDRISSYPTYAIIGAGEGDLSRFPHSHQIEIHSTPMTILFSYGIIGVLTFGLFIFRLLKGATWIQRISVASMLLYSITHNGIRFTFFWITLAVIAAQPWAVRQETRSFAHPEPQ